MKYARRDVFKHIDKNTCEVYKEEKISRLKCLIVNFKEFLIQYKSLIVFEITIVIVVLSITRYMISLG